MVALPLNAGRGPFLRGVAGAILGGRRLGRQRLGQGDALGVGRDTVGQTDGPAALALVDLEDQNTLRGRMIERGAQNEEIRAQLGDTQ